MYNEKSKETQNISFFSISLTEIYPKKTGGMGEKSSNSVQKTHPCGAGYVQQE
ncbi:MAG: hypothetical protein ACYDG2_24660 [Ruminiclostridium sp.]